MSYYGWGPYKYEFGCHGVKVLGEKDTEGAQVWEWHHVHDVDGNPIAWFRCEEDAVELVERWNSDPTIWVSKLVDDKPKET